MLSEADVRRLLQHVTNHRNAQRNHVIILLSFKAGLRACEIAGLTWPMILTASGKLADHIDIASSIAKMGSGRRIPLHPQLKTALRHLHQTMAKPLTGPVVRSEQGGHLTARSVVNLFAEIYAALRLDGCSSHSGRRTFITQAARLLAKTGGSLRDIQELAGHRAITTTERYIQGDRAIQRRLVSLL
ncbi:site-specific integrase [Sphingomonas sp. C3-2]|uniref:tyrosine-type recombinase/integrase n=1 Tax=Sphingomonas sp. C3-2 TaxID=3062169 RepID=UPI00294B58B4|nr:site-specific integrase [Sphingomonas sp. C3-2]WOK37288.1 site-specific integrase [Sphingomonas sp. C3-2]